MLKYLHKQIIAVAYKDAGLLGRLYVKLKSIKNPQINNYINEFRKTKTSIDTKREIECPAYLYENLLPGITFKEKQTLKRHYNNPAFVTISSAFAAVVVVVLLLNYRGNISRANLESENANIEKALKLFSHATELTRSPMMKRLFSEETIFSMYKAAMELKNKN